MKKNIITTVKVFSSIALLGVITLTPTITFASTSTEQRILNAKIKNGGEVLFFEKDGVIIIKEKEKKPRIGKACAIAKTDEVKPEIGEAYKVDKPSRKNAYLDIDGVADAPVSGNTLPILKEERIGSATSNEKIYQTSLSSTDQDNNKINPATGQPLWATQPFWRTDGSFDIYGYLKQFQPVWKNTYADITLNKNNGVGSSIKLFLGNDSSQFPATYIDIPLTGDPSMADYINSDQIDYDYTSARSVGLMDFRPQEENNTILERNGYILLADLIDQGEARITGTSDCSIHSAIIPQLEEIMRDWIEDPKGVNFSSKKAWEGGSTNIYYGKLVVGSGPKAPN